MALEDNAMPIGDATTYGGSESTTTWDEDKIFGCVCDSAWTVGYAADETQEPQWFGPDCSLKHCPSGDDPMTDADETDCEDKDQNGAVSNALGAGPGAVDNKCHVDCANRGICDYTTGECRCFEGFYGEACTLRSALARQQ
jgi:hypothetical protein